MGLGLGIMPKIMRAYDRLKGLLIYPFNKYIRFPREYNNQVRLAELVRHKDNISVLFVLTSLASWKTEGLYLEMSRHRRFSTFILITTALDENALPELREYLNKKGYPFFELENGKDIYSKIIPDIIFYEKPYDSYLSDEGLRFDHYHKSLYCYAYYSLHFTKEHSAVLLNTHFQNIVYQDYFENINVATEVAKYMSNRGRNNVVTGLSFYDGFITFEKSKNKDPWKKQDRPKKRIIYAPHHTIEHKDDFLPYSTFLEYYDFMLEMAEKYKNKVQFAFKPHPVLKGKLYRIWGKERTDNYYKRWDEIENGQLETGEYQSLFMFSDAMIHDSGAYRIEYHYTHNPVMYLTHNEEYSRKGLTEFGKKAFDLHYFGHNKTEIEQFILNVINGTDPLRKDRLRFYNEYLLPPNGQTATHNIINAILGEGEYKNV